VEAEEGGQELKKVEVAEDANGPTNSAQPATFRAAQVATNGAKSLACSDGKVWLRSGGEEWAPLKLEGLDRAVHACWGGDTIWLIDELEHGSEVKQYSLTGDLIRRLATDPADPIPKWIAASGREDIYLLEENSELQRVRILSRQNDQQSKTGAGGDASPTSTWKTSFARTINFSDTFQQVAGKLGRPQPFRPESRITVRLLPNPLYKDTATTVVLEMGCDSEGAVVRTADGLPLLHVTETKDLKWAVMGRENGSKAITVFESDGAVVEEFRAGKLANMMSFDAGEYDWSGK
jgi:hypothetical protein